MKRGVRQLSIKRLLGNQVESINDIVVKEFPLTIVLNDNILVTLVCFPAEQKQLVVGFLFTEGIISGKSDIKEIIEDNKRGIIWVKTKRKVKNSAELMKRRTITTGCGEGMSFRWGERVESLKKIESDIRISPDEIRNLIRQLRPHSEIYRQTGGVHSAALCDTREIIVSCEDIGRHNVIDKILGRCLLENISPSNKILITSGRLSSEIVMKAAIGNIPVVISRTAPTDLGIKIARKINMTLVGFARGQRMNIYSGIERIES